VAETGKEEILARELGIGAVSRADKLWGGDMVEFEATESGCT